MHDIRDERPAGEALAVGVLIDVDQLRKILPIFHTESATSITRTILTNSHEDTSASGEFVSVAISADGEAFDARDDFLFKVRLVSSDESQVNFLLLECPPMSAKRLGKLLGRDSATQEFYVMIIEPSLHTQDTSPNLVIQAVACIEDDDTLVSSTRAREAVRQLLAVA